VRSRLMLLLFLSIAACSGDDQEPTDESADVGFVRITSATAGLALDSNAYTVTLDPGTAGAVTQELPRNGRSDFGGIPVGDHTFLIEDIAGNCSLAGNPSQTLTVLGHQLQNLSYTLTCTAAPLTGPNRIAFQSDRDGFNEIYTMNPDGTNQTRVTQDELDNTEPSFAPDGQTIAFVQSTEDGSDIYVVGADGSGEINLTETALESDPAWSPDASRIAFLSDPEFSGGLVVKNADTTEFRTDPDTTEFRVLFRGGLAGKPAWSPDGLQLAFESDTAIRVMTLNSGGASATALFTGEAHNPAWSPDGTRIAFDSPSQADGPGIFVMNGDGSGLTRVTVGDDHAPTWSPDGSQIAFSRGAEDTEAQDIFVVNADGSGLTQLTTDAAADSHPSWSH
jgi:Tol biopolymer transport system component